MFLNYLPAVRDRNIPLTSPSLDKQKHDIQPHTEIEGQLKVHVFVGIWTNLLGHGEKGQTEDGKNLNFAAARGCIFIDFEYER